MDNNNLLNESTQNEFDEISDYYQKLAEKRRNKNLAKLQNIPSGFNAQDLLESLEKIPKEQRLETGIYIRVPHDKLPFNLETLDSIYTPENGYWDLEGPILILNTTTFSPKT